MNDDVYIDIMSSGRARKEHGVHVGSSVYLSVYEYAGLVLHYAEPVSTYSDTVISAAVHMPPLIVQHLILLPPLYCPLQIGRTCCLSVNQSIYICILSSVRCACLPACTRLLPFPTTIVYRSFSIYACGRWGRCVYLSVCVCVCLRQVCDLELRVIAPQLLTDGVHLGQEFNQQGLQLGRLGRCCCSGISVYYGDCCC